MRKKIKFILLFLSLVWRNWYYKGIDKWHPYKHRISIKTAWNTAKIIYG